MNTTEILITALRSIIIQADGDLSDTDFRAYARNIIAEKVLVKVEDASRPNLVDRGDGSLVFMTDAETTATIAILH